MMARQESIWWMVGMWTQISFFFSEWYFRLKIALLFHSLSSIQPTSLCLIHFRNLLSPLVGIDLHFQSTFGHSFIRA